MKVLLVHYNSTQGGGAESAIRDLATALEKVGCETRIEYRWPERAYAEWKPDVIHYHTIHVGIGIQTLAWAQKKGIPHCISLHDYWPFCGSRMMLKRRDESCAGVEGVCDGVCDGGRADQVLKEIVNESPVIVFNQFTADIMQRNGVRTDAVIPYGLDKAVWNFDPAQKRTIRVVTSSAWPDYPTKGMHILKAAASKSRIPVVLVSGQPRMTVREALRQSQVYVFPSCYQETFGLGLAEALACGCACIASDVAGAKAQITHGKTGLLYEAHDVDALAEAMTWLDGDPFVRQILRHYGVQSVRSDAEMANDYLKFYKGLAA